MYKNVFYFFYKFVELKGERYQSPIFTGAVQVALVQVIHLFFLLTMLRHYFGVTIPTLTSDTAVNRVILSPIILIWGILVYKYFTKDRVAQIVKEGDRKFQNIFGVGSILKILLTYLVPLVIGIYFAKLQH